MCGRISEQVSIPLAASVRVVKAAWHQCVRYRHRRGARPARLHFTTTHSSESLDLIFKSYSHADVSRSKNAKVKYCNANTGSDNARAALNACRAACSTRLAKTNRWIRRHKQAASPGIRETTPKDNRCLCLQVPATLQHAYPSLSRGKRSRTNTWHESLVRRNRTTVYTVRLESTTHLDQIFIVNPPSVRALPRHCRRQAVPPSE